MGTEGPINLPKAVFRALAVLLGALMAHRSRVLRSTNVTRHDRDSLRLESTVSTSQ